MASYQEARVKLINTQLNKLIKSAAKNKTGAILRINKKTLKMKICNLSYF